MTYLQKIISLSSILGISMYFINQDYAFSLEYGGQEVARHGGLTCGQRTLFRQDPNQPTRIHQGSPTVFADTHGLQRHAGLTYGGLAQRSDGGESVTTYSNQAVFNRVANTAAAHHQTISNGGNVPGSTLRIVQNNRNNVTVEGQFSHEPEPMRGVTRSQDPHDVINMPFHGTANSSYMKTSRNGDGGITVLNIYPKPDHRFGETVHPSWDDHYDANPHLRPRPLTVQSTIHTHIVPPGQPRPLTMQSSTVHAHIVPSGQHLPSQTVATTQVVNRQRPILSVSSITHTNITAADH